MPQEKYDEPDSSQDSDVKQYPHEFVGPHWLHGPACDAPYPGTAQHVCQGRYHEDYEDLLMYDWNGRKFRVSRYLCQTNETLRILA